MVYTGNTSDDLLTNYGQWPPCPDKMTLFLPKCWLHNKLEVTFGVSLGLKRAPRHKTTGTWHQLGNIDCAQNGRKRKFEDVQKAIYVMHRKVVCASPKDHQSVFKLKEKYFFDTFQTLTQKNINQECFYPPPLFAPFPARMVCISGRVLRQSLFRISSAWQSFHPTKQQIWDLRSDSVIAHFMVAWIGYSWVNENWAFSRRESCISRLI